MSLSSLLDVCVAHHLVGLLEERGRQVLHLRLEVLPQPRQLHNLRVALPQRRLERRKLLLQLPEVALRGLEAVVEADAPVALLVAGMTVALG